MAKNVAENNDNSVNSLSKKSLEFPLNKKNLLFIAGSFVVIIIGYLLMSTGITDEPAIPNGKWNNPLAVDVAPIVLLIGYCVLIPIGILKNFDKKKKVDN